MKQKQFKIRKINIACNSITKKNSNMQRSPLEWEWIFLFIMVNVRLLHIPTFIFIKHFSFHPFNFFQLYVSEDGFCEMLNSLCVDVTLIEAYIKGYRKIISKFYTKKKKKKTKYKIKTATEYVEPEVLDKKKYRWKNMNAKAKAKKNAQQNKRNIFNNIRYRWNMICYLKTFLFDLFPMIKTTSLRITIILSHKRCWLRWKDWESVVSGCEPPTANPFRYLIH